MLNTKKLGRNLLEFDELGSTNTYLKENSSDLPDGTAVIAKCQTNGKGRLGKVWNAESDMLSMSVLLKALDNPMKVTLMSAIAVTQAIEALYPLKAQIKWTNDIIVNEHKVCGILCESRINGEHPDIVCGIGVNVLTRKAFFEEHNLPYGSSLYILSGKEIPPKEMGEEILNKLEPLLSMSFEEVKEEYKQRCVTLGRAVRAVINNNEVIAKAIDIDDTGRLVCENKSGRFTINAGEVSVRGLYGYI